MAMPSVVPAAGQLVAAEQAAVELAAAGRLVAAGPVAVWRSAEKPAAVRRFFLADALLVTGEVRLAGQRIWMVLGSFSRLHLDFGG